MVALNPKRSMMRPPVKSPAAEPIVPTQVRAELAVARCSGRKSSARWIEAEGT
jgi:hypothetical protein